MKKINSIHYGYKIILCILLFLIVIPIFLYLPFHYLHVILIKPFIIISFTIGVLITIFFIILLTIEFHQDKKLAEYFSNNKNKKILLDSGEYECQACGNRKLTGDDQYCKICGTRFKNIY